VFFGDLISFVISLIHSKTQEIIDSPINEASNVWPIVESKNSSLTSVLHPSINQAIVLKNESREEKIFYV